MSNKNKVFGEARSLNHKGVEQVPRRVASRMEGVVKNRGSKSGKK